MDKVENLVCDKLRCKEQSKGRKIYNYHRYKYSCSESLYMKLLNGYDLEKFKYDEKTDHYHGVPYLIPTPIDCEFRNYLGLKHNNKYFLTYVDKYGNVRKKLGSPLHKYFSMDDLKEVVKKLGFHVPSKFKKNKKLFVEYLIKNY